MITDMFLSSFMTHQRVCNKSNTTGIICGARTVYTRTEHMNSPLVFSGVRVAQFLIFRLNIAESGVKHQNQIKSNIYNENFYGAL
jgi:hypothetical protein